MRIASLMLIVALLFVPSMVSALDLGVSASVTGGAALGTTVLLQCTGYSYNPAGDPWGQCTNLGSSTTLNFGTLITRLKDSGGFDIGGAGCFYAEKFFIVYLFPDAWGGTGYDIQQQASATPAAIANALVFAPVYATQDKYSGAATGQGALNAEETINNPNVNQAQLAKSLGRILKAKRPRIVRAEYGIPPFPGTGQTRPTGWTAVPIDTLNGIYAITIQITMTTW